MTVLFKNEPMANPSFRVIDNAETWGADPATTDLVSSGQAAEIAKS